MTDKDIEKLAALLESLVSQEVTSTSGVLQSELFAAVAAIRQLMKEKDEAHRDGQRDMQLRALEVANNAAIFERIMGLEIKGQPPF